MALKIELYERHRAVDAPKFVINDARKVQDVVPAAVLEAKIVASP